MANKNQEFDRLFKENADQLFIPLIRLHLGLEILEYEELPTELTKTLSRAVDYLCKFKDKAGNEQILHIEFQTSSDPIMVYRMAEYHGFLLKEYKLPIRHVVIYLGGKQPTFRVNLDEREVFRNFELINFLNMDSRDLLASDLPEVFMLALLGKYDENNLEKVLKLILNKLGTLDRSAKEKARFLHQFLILSRLNPKHSIGF